MQLQIPVFIALLLISSTVFAEDYTDIPSTQAKLDARAAESRANYPEEMQQLMQDGIDAAQGAVNTAIKVGDKAPEFALPNAEGEEVTLSQLLQDGPVVITWYRGGWCPYCNIQLHDLSALVHRFEEVGAQLIAISPEQPDSSLSTKEKHELKMHILSDLHNQVAHEYGIVFELTDPLKDIYREHLGLEAYNLDDSYELPLAVTYVVDQNQIVTWAFIEADYKLRAEPKDVLLAVQALSDNK